MARLICLLAGLASGLRVAGPARSVVRMGAIGPAAPVVVVGNGPVYLLTAKTAAALGHPTTIVTNQPEKYAELLWGDEKPSEKLTMLGVSTDSDVERFNKAIGEAAGVAICYDLPGQVLPDNLLNVVLPPSDRSRRVALLSRHLNGKGNGALCAAAKASANSEVWVHSPASLELYKSFETKLEAKVRESPDTDLVTVRCGTLKGGGPGYADSATDTGASPSLSYSFYRQGQQDLVNWRLLFDCDTNGVQLTPGDTAPGPGWKAILAATSAEAEQGDSGRVACAQAVIRALRLDELAWRDFGVETRKARHPPTDGEWDTKFADLIKKVA